MATTIKATKIGANPMHFSVIGHGDTKILNSEPRKVKGNVEKLTSCCWFLRRILIECRSPLTKIQITEFFLELENKSFKCVFANSKDFKCDACLAI